MSIESLYLNGDFMPLSEGRLPVEDRGLQFGDSVYEVVKIMNGRLVWLEEHLERLDGSLAAVDNPGAVAGHRLERVLPELASRSGIDQGMAYIQVTRGVSPREFEFPGSSHPTVLAYVRSRPAPAVAAIRAGVTLHAVEDLRWARCDVKATDLLASVLAKEEARKAGADEALFVASDGTVREGGSSNVFAVLGGVLRTHAADNHVLAGITRRHVLDLARGTGYVVEERAFNVAEVTLAADVDCEVFLASTLRDIMPVVRVGTELIGGGRPGRITLALLDSLRRLQSVLVGLQPPAALSG